jgi:hypothetical protein
MESVRRSSNPDPGHNSPEHRICPLFSEFEEELEIPMLSLAELTLLVSPCVEDFLAERISRATSEYLLRYRPIVLKAA